MTPAQAQGRVAALVSRWRHLARDSAYLALGTSAGLLARLVLTLVFARFATPTVYGEYRYVVTAIGIAAVAVLPGMTPAIVRASARGHDRTLAHGAMARLRVALVGSAALVGLGVWYARHDQAAMGLTFLLGAVFFPFMTAFDLYLPFLSGKGAFKRYALYQGLTMAVPIPFVAAAVMAHSRLEVTAFVWMAATTLVQVACFISVLRGADRQSAVDDSDLRYGRRVSAAYLVSTGQMYLPALVTGAWLGPVSLAQLSVGMTVWEIFRRAFSLVNVRSQARMATGTGAEARARMVRSLERGAPVVAAAAIGAVAIMPVAVPALFTAQYHASVVVAQILAVGAAATFPGNQANAFLAARGRDREQSLLLISTALVEIIVLLALIRHVGVVGVAIAKLAMRVWYSGYGLALARRVAA